MLGKMLQGKIMLYYKGPILFLLKTGRHDIQHNDIQHNNVKMRHLANYAECHN
jgi:hypothetical protein